MTDVVMPQMGESIVEGTLTRWLKKPGEKVERDEPLFEISTDKVDTEIPSPAAGVLSEILVQEGTTVAINSVVARIGDANGAAPAAAARCATGCATSCRLHSRQHLPPPPPAPASSPSPADVGPSARAQGSSRSCTTSSSGAERRWSVPEHSRPAGASSSSSERTAGRKRRPGPVVASRAEDGSRIQHRSFADPRHWRWRAHHEARRRSSYVVASGEDLRRAASRAEGN